MMNGSDRGDCPFCEIAAVLDDRVVYLWDGGEIVAFEPLFPRVRGHLLVVPRQHVRDAGECREVTGAVFAAAADLVAVAGQSNLITSVGSAATQTVFHFHAHVIPRREGDGLLLPWSDQWR